MSPYSKKDKYNNYISNKIQYEDTGIIIAFKKSLVVKNV